MSRQEFENRAVAHLREGFPEKYGKKPDEEVRKFVQQGIRSAAQYKVTGENDVLRYLTNMVIYGAEYDTNPNTNWAGQVLRTRRLTGTEKMDAIDELAPKVSVK